jgi:hypothetical protein
MIASLPIQLCSSDLQCYESKLGDQHILVRQQKPDKRVLGVQVYDVCIRRIGERSHVKLAQQLFVIGTDPPQAAVALSIPGSKGRCMHADVPAKCWEMYQSDHRWANWGRGVELTGKNGNVITCSNSRFPSARLVIGNIIIGATSTTVRDGYFEVKIAGGKINEKTSLECILAS